MEGEKREDRRLPLPLFYPPYFPKLHAYQTPLGKLLVAFPENFMHRSSPLWIELQFFTDIYPLFIPFRREQGTRRKTRKRWTRRGKNCEEKEFFEHICAVGRVQWNGKKIWQNKRKEKEEEEEGEWRQGRICQRSTALWTTR